MTALQTPKWSSLPAFTTLDACLAHVRKTHPQSLRQVTAKAVGTGAPIDATIPSFLYRGEVGWYDECLSRMERVRRGCFPGVTTTELEPHGQEVDAGLNSRLGLDQMLSAGLMQHYGFPTELMDATGSIETAAYFSRFGAGGTAVGAFAVFEMATLRSNSIVIDLSSHPGAVRPRRQEAYGLMHRHHTDLKKPDAISQMKITWYTFLADPHEVQRVASGARLLSVSDDETAGMLRLELDGSIEDHQKVTHATAVYLANRIAHCPLVAKVVSWYKPGQPKEIELITPDQAGISINEQDEIAVSTKLWSRDHPEMIKRPVYYA